MLPEILFHLNQRMDTLFTSSGKDTIPTHEYSSSFPSSSPLEQTYASVVTNTISFTPLNYSTTDSAAAAYVQSVVHRQWATIRTEDIYRFAMRMHDCIVTKRIAFHPLVELIGNSIVTFLREPDSISSSSSSAMDSSTDSANDPTYLSRASYLPLLSLIYAFVQQSPERIPLLAIDIVIKSVISAIIVSNHEYGLSFSTILSSKFMILTKVSSTLFTTVLTKDEQLMVYLIIEGLCQRNGNFAEANLLILFLEYFRIDADTYRSLPTFVPFPTEHGDPPMESSTGITSSHHLLQSEDPLAYMIRRVNQAIIHYIEVFFTLYDETTKHNSKYLALDNPTNAASNDSSPGEASDTTPSSSTEPLSTETLFSSKIISRQKAAMYIVRLAIVYRVRCTPYPYCCCCTEFVKRFPSSFSDTATTTSQLAYLSIPLTWKLLDITIERQVWDTTRRICLEIFPSLPNDPPCTYCTERTQRISSSSSLLSTTVPNINHSVTHKQTMDIVSQLSALRYVAEASELYHQRRVHKEFTSLYDKIANPYDLSSSSLATIFPSTNTSSISNTNTTSGTKKPSSFVGVFPSSVSASIAVTSSLSTSLQNPEAVASHGTLGNGLSRPFDTLPLDQQNRLMDRPTPASILTQLELFKGHGKASTDTMLTVKDKPTYESIKERQNRARESVNRSKANDTKEMTEKWREVTPALLPRELEDRLFMDKTETTDNVIKSTSTVTDHSTVGPRKWEASPFMVPRSLTEAMNQSTQDSNAITSTTASASIVKTALAQQLKVGKDKSGIYMIDPPSEYQERSLLHILDHIRSIPLALIYCGNDPDMQIMLLKELIYRHRFNEAKGCLRTFLLLNNVPLYETSSVSAITKDETVPSVTGTDTDTSSTTTSTNAKVNSILTSTKLYGKINFYDIDQAAQHWLRKDKLDFMYHLLSPVHQESAATTMNDNLSSTLLEKNYYGLSFVPIKHDSHFWAPLFTDKENTVSNTGDGANHSSSPNLTIVRTLEDLRDVRKELELIFVATDEVPAETNEKNRSPSRVLPFQFLSIDTEWRPDGLYDHSLPLYRTEKNTLQSTTATELHQCLSSGTTTNDKVSSMNNLRWPTSILQLSTVQRTWIIDILSLINLSSPFSSYPLPTVHELGVFLRWLFYENTYFIKIGYRIEGDLIRLVTSYPVLRKYMEKVKPVIDISTLLTILTMYEQGQQGRLPVSSSVSTADLTGHHRMPVLPSLLNHSNNHVLGNRLATTLSLSSLIQKYLGKPLDKRCQTSDWQRRPLSPMQIIYAATDAKAVVCLAYRMLDKIPFYELYTKYLQEAIRTETLNVLPAVAFDHDIAKRIVTVLLPTMVWNCTVKKELSKNNASESVTNDTQGIPEFERGFCSFFNPNEEEYAVSLETSDVSFAPLRCLYTILDESSSILPVTAATAPTTVHSSSSSSTLPTVDTSHALGSDDVATALSHAGLDPRIHHLVVTSDATTAVYASESLGIPHSAVVKSLAFWNHTDPQNPQPLLFLIAGDCVMDYTKATKYLNIPKKKLKLASAQECVNVWGYVPGTFPPLGLRSRIPVYIDELIESRAVVTPQDTSGIRYVYAGGGSIRHSIRITWEQLLMVTEGKVCDMATINTKNVKKEEDTGKMNQNTTVTKDTDIVLTNPPLSAPAIESNLPHLQEELGSLPLPIFDIERPKFLVDTMLGRMLRWLRVIGVDAETVNGYEANVWYENKFSPTPTLTPAVSSLPLPVPLSVPSNGSTVSLDHGLMIEWANESRRIILTRDRKLLNRKESCVAYFLLSSDTPSQFDEVVNRFGITVRPGDLMSRCAKCNGLGYEHMTPTQLREAKNQYPLIYDTPDKVIDMVAEFWRCPRCLKVYWEGPKFEETRDKYWTLFGNPHGLREEGTVMVEKDEGDGTEDDEKAETDA